MLKKGDIYLAVSVTLAIILGFAGIGIYKNADGNTRQIAVIKQNNKVIKEIDLSKVENSERIRIDGEFNEVVLVEKGRIRFEEADCPDQVCVKMGWLSKKGDMAVCLPNRTIIKIEGQSDNIDGIVY